MGKAIHFTDELFKFQSKYQPKPKFTSISIFGDSLSDNGNLSSFFKSLGLGKDLLGLIADKSFLSFVNTLNPSELLAHQT